MKWSLLDKLYRWSMYLSQNSDFVSKYLIQFRMDYAVKHDTLLHKIIEDTKDANKIIYDIGANNGTHAFNLVKKCKCKVYAFEPNPAVFSNILKLIDLFGIRDKLLPLNIAVSDSNCSKEFYISTEHARSSLNKYNACYDNQEVLKQIIVDCCSIDYLVDNNKCLPPDGIKIDTEGHEYEVLMGAQQTIKKYKPIIWFEPHVTSNNENDSDQVDKITQLLKRNNYEVKAIGYGICCYPISCTLG